MCGVISWPEQIISPLSDNLVKNTFNGDLGHIAAASSSPKFSCFDCSFASFWLFSTAVVQAAVSCGSFFVLIIHVGVSKLNEGNCLTLRRVRGDLCVHPINEMLCIGWLSLHYCGNVGLKAERFVMRVFANLDNCRAEKVRCKDQSLQGMQERLGF